MQRRPNATAVEEAGTHSLRLVQVLVAQAERGVARAALFRAQDGKGDLGGLQDLHDGARGLDGGVIKGARAAALTPVEKTPHL